MSSESSTFRPRPEAQATSWDELMPPVQEAVHDLLVRIQGAHHNINIEKSDNSSKSKTQQTGNCFLVYGSRGTGKTTVLLNAQRAVSRKEGETFFNESTNQTEEPSKKTEQAKARKDARDHARSLRDGDIVWLDILNLEPLPSEANLLTVLLTQIRNALHSHNDKRHSERRSIFEEDAGSARQLLDKLINDAALMWQNVKEADTRNLSNRQVKAAEIYAGFQESFKEAMDKLVKELSDAPDSEKKLSIVLPIDNIDRSSDHLQSIVKLAQLVSHPNLFLIMAGDRVEVETFLERAYWKELIRSSDSAGAQGKRDSDGEDEAQVMARHQANATQQKLWPPNHRVEINLVKPEETLAFYYRHDACSTSINDIRTLLGAIQIPTTKSQRETNYSSESKTEDIITLFDLFYVKDKVKDGLKQTKDKEPIEIYYLTRAAHHGLLLPARSVLDLWQFLDWQDKDEEASSIYRDFKAEKIARTMLRNAISSSQLPNWLAQKLQNEILRRGERGGTVLNFDEEALNLEIKPLTSSNYDFEFALTPIISTLQNSEYKCQSRLIVNNIEDLACFIKQLDSPNEGKTNQYSQNNKIRNKIELPPLVSAWLVILYDILILAEAESSSWLIASPEVKYENVHVRHAIATKAGKHKYENVCLRWNAPDWNLFWGRNIFRLSWWDFREKLAKFPKAQIHDAQALVPRALAAGWIFCVLKTAVELIKSIDPPFDFQGNDNFSEFEKNIKEIKDIQASEKNIMKAAGSFYQLIQDQKQNQLAGHQTITSTSYESMRLTEYPVTEQESVISASYELMVTTESPSARQKPINDAAYEVMIVTGEWLETELINFLSSGYVPLKPEVSQKRHPIMWDSLDKTALQGYWESNLPFILAKLDKDRVSYFEDVTDKKTESDKQAEAGQVNNRDDNARALAELLFADLYQHLEPSGI